ncbi:HNH endonuclease [Nesterenkonia halophila]|uniref:HNH endonuclease n=1 Tax=Nesterenkonia halophila TaxID=302044 RepID=UPI001FEC3B1F|nr:HNH endonuclease signature motif containing protein [Nesterenkonia halophila]
MEQLEQRLRADLQFRELAFRWLHLKSEAATRSLLRSEIEEFEGHVPEARYRLILQEGIWKPAELMGALSLTSGAPGGRKGRNVYDDVLTEQGYVEYEFVSSPKKQHQNQALRDAFHYGLPLIYFRGIRKSLFDAYFPVWIVHVDEEKKRVLLNIVDGATPGGRLDLTFSEHGALPESEPAYGEHVVRTRLHQRDFRASVMYSYRTQCAVCSLGHARLLDAAHIVPDRDGGIPDVNNGLSLCKIHHSAFDANILGVDPNYKVHIRHDILNEADGPMLKHGLQDHHGQPLRVVPQNRNERAGKDHLEYRFSQFQDA